MTLRHGPGLFHVRFFSRVVPEPLEALVVADTHPWQTDDRKEAMSAVQ